MSPEVTGSTGTVSSGRANTVLPPEEDLLETDSKFFLAKTNKELLVFANEVLGLPIPANTSRNTILTRIFNTAISRVDS